MPEFSVRADSVNVEEIMRQIRGRVKEKRGADYTEEEIKELASVKLERFLDPLAVRSGLLDEYRRRRDQLCEWLSAEPRIRLTKPAGAFYLFPDVSEFLSPDGIRTSAELATALLNEARVALTPGEAFDAPGFLRISYATSMKELERGSQRILEFLAARAALVTTSTPEEFRTRIEREMRKWNEIVPKAGVKVE